MASKESTFEERAVWACGNTCLDCPVAGLDEDKRKAVDTLFVYHGVEADEADDEALKTYADEALRFEGTQSPSPEEIALVASAARRIVRQTCLNY